MLAGAVQNIHILQPKPNTMTKSLIYAELLSNIRQVSVISALHTPCDASTKVELSKAGQQFVLYHAGEVITLDLPGQVSPKAPLQTPTPGSKEISWRLPLAHAAAAAGIESSQDNEVPWSARDPGRRSRVLVSQMRFCHYQERGHQGMERSTK